MSGSSQHRLDGLTILVIDDDREAVDALEEYLEGEGARIIAIGSAKAALAITRTLQLDAILVALRMPAEDGQWFLRQFRRARAPGTATVPVFALSMDRHCGVDPQSGFSGYFLKPVDVDMVLALIAALEPLPRRPL